MRRYGMSGLLLAFEILILVVVLALSMAGVVFGKRASKPSPLPPVASSENINDDWGSEIGSLQPEPSETESESQSESEVLAEERLDFSEEVEAWLAELTNEEKAAQLFFVSPEALTNVTAATVAGNATNTAITTYPIGGMCYEAKNFQKKQQVSQLLNKTQQYCRSRIGIDLFLAVEEEGGQNHAPVAAALDYQIGMAASEFSDDAEAAGSAAAGIAGYLKEIGFNMNLAPVASMAGDLEEADGDRTFGTEPEKAIPLIRAQTENYARNGIVPVLKYFPGKGSYSGDGNLSVYKDAIGAGASCIMIGNAAWEEVTGSVSLPCSLSPEAVHILRSECGFDGIILTDSFSDEEITSRYRAGLAAVMAIQAGADMIYQPADFAAAYQEVVDAIISGEISQDRLDNAVGRILTVKAKAGMLAELPDNGDE